MSRVILPHIACQWSTQLKLLRNPLAHSSPSGTAMKVQRAIRLDVELVKWWQACYVLRLPTAVCQERIQSTIVARTSFNPPYVGSSTSGGLKPTPRVGSSAGFEQLSWNRCHFQWHQRGTSVGASSFADSSTDNLGVSTNGNSNISAPSSCPSCMQESSHFNVHMPFTMNPKITHKIVAKAKAKALARVRAWARRARVKEKAVELFSSRSTDKLSLLQRLPK